MFRSESEQVGSNNAAYGGLNGLTSTTLTAIGPGVNPFGVTTPPVLLPVGAPNNPFSAPAALVADFPQMGMLQTQYVTNTYRLFGDIRGTAAGWDIDGTAGFMYAALTQKAFGFVSPGALGAAAAADFNFATATAAQLEQTIADTRTEVPDI